MLASVQKRMLKLCFSLLQRHRIVGPVVWQNLQVWDSDEEEGDPEDRGIYVWDSEESYTPEEEGEGEEEASEEEYSEWTFIAEAQ